MENLKECICCHNLFLTETSKEINMCDKCEKEIKQSLKYFINGKEVSYEEYKKYLGR